MGVIQRKKIHIDPLIPLRPPSETPVYSDILAQRGIRLRVCVCVYSQTLSSSRPRLAEPTKIKRLEKGNSITFCSFCSLCSPKLSEARKVKK